MIGPAFQPSGGLTVRDFLHDIYVPSRLELSPLWLEQLEIVVRQFAVFAGNPRIGDLSDEMVCRFLRDCLDRGLAPATVNGKRAKLLALWRCAWRKRLHAEQPRDIPRCREPRNVPRAWLVDEIQCLVGHAAKLPGTVGELPAAWWWSTLIMVVWETGLRIGAARRMTPQDFLPRGPAVMARSNTQKTLLGQCLPLSQPLAAALAEHLDPGRELIWPWPYCRRWFFLSFRRLVEAAGLTASRNGHDLFYKLRRSHLSYLARVSLETARRQAGHTNAAITLRHYIDPTIAETQPAVDLLPPVSIPGGKF